VLRHPVHKASLRALLQEPSTWLFVAFTAAITCFLLVLEGVQKSREADVFSDEDRILIVANGIAPRYPLPVRYAKEIVDAAIPGIEKSVAVNFVPATMGGERKRLAAMAADPAGLLATNTDIVVLGAAAQRWIEDRNSVLIGRDFAEREGLSIGDAIAVHSNLFRLAGDEPSLRLRIAGTYAVRGDAYPAFGVILHEKLIRPLGQVTAGQGASSILVLLKSRGDAAEVSRRIDEKYAKAPVTTRTVLREQFVEAFNDQGAGMATLMQLYGLAGVLAGGLLLATFCYFNARRLEAVWSTFDEIGFGLIHVVARAAMTMTLVILLGAIAGALVTLLGAELFEVAIKYRFPYFSASPVSAIVILSVMTAITLVLSIVTLLMVVGAPGSTSTRRLA
jgi:hypothetical protein